MTYIKRNANETDIEIAHEIEMKPITEVGAASGFERSWSYTADTKQR